MCYTLIIDKEKTKGDTLSGKVTVTDDSVFVLSIPYDKGFTVYIDGKETDYYLANEAFIGFDITKGEHTVTLCYKAPLKTAGFAVSGIGIALFICAGLQQTAVDIADEGNVRADDPADFPQVHAALGIQ